MRPGSDGVSILDIVSGLGGWIEDNRADMAIAGVAWFAVTVDTAASNTGPSDEV